MSTTSGIQGSGITSEARSAPRIKAIRFLRDLQFPRFSMKAGETWPHGFDPVRGLGATARAYFEATDSGVDRFSFAGGFCFTKDVEPVLQTAEDIEREQEVDAWLRSRAS